MSRSLLCKKSLRRYVRLLLEELEGRYVPSQLGVSIDLPLPAMVSPLSISIGTGTASTPAQSATFAPTTTSSGTTPTSVTLTVVTVSFTPASEGSVPSSVPASGSSAGVSQAPAAASSGSTASAPSSGSPSVFSQGFSSGSSSAFAGSSSASPANASALAIQAGFPGSSTTLGGTVVGGSILNADFELLGNLPWLQGPANFQQGTTSAAVSPSSLAGAPLAGSVFGRPDLATNRTTGVTTAFGLSHPAPGDQEEELPGQLIVPPDQNWFEPAPQNGEQAPPDNVLLPNLVNFLRMALPKSDAGHPQILNAAPADQQEDGMFDEEDLGLADEPEQPDEEHSGMSAAVAMLCGGVGAFWSIRDRRVRKDAEGLPVFDEEID